MNRRAMLGLILAGALAAPLAACGRRGQPIRPENAADLDRFPTVGYPAEPTRPRSDDAWEPTEEDASQDQPGTVQ